MQVQQPSQFSINSMPYKLGNNKKSNPSFGGIETPLIQVLRYLQTNQAWGACAVDVGCMGVPRTTVDFTRGPEAGIETARREFSSTINHALIGMYGTVAGLALCHGINKVYNMKAHKLFMSDEMIDILAHNWDKSRNTPKPVDSLLENVLSKIEGFSPENKKANASGRVSIDAKTVNLVKAKLASEIKTGPESISQATMDYARSLITSSVGSESNVKITEKIGDKTVTSVSSLETLLKNIYNAGKTFTNPKVAKTFDGNLSSNEFVKTIKKMNPKIAIGGLGIAIAVGLCLQPLNAYLTKKKTGKSGFVGVEGREPDKSNKFKLMKLAAAGAFGAGMIRTIGKFSEVLSRVQFKGFTPTIPQFKLIYAMTIMSRIMAARDQNELRESAIKDSLGFVNWLILGGFVSKLVGMGIEKMSAFKNNGEKFIRYNEQENGKGFFNKLINSDIVSRDEVLLEAIKKAGKSNIKADGKAMEFSEMFEFVSKFDKQAVKKVRWLGAVQIAGYLWSGLALGVGIPKLNIAITKHKEKKKADKENAAKITEENKVEEIKSEEVKTEETQETKSKEIKTENPEKV